MSRLYSARKKLIRAMSLDIDRPITRAVVVGCAISATRNYLKFHMSRTLKYILVQPSCQNAEVVEAFCQVAASRSNIPVDQIQQPVRCCTSRARRDACV